MSTSAVQSPTAKASMLIRRPAAEVFEAVVSPEVLTQFWLSRASGPLEPGKTVHWEFLVPGAEADAFVETLDENRRILMRWSDGTTADWTFEARPDGTTRIAVENAGFSGNPSEVIEAALEATQGFTIVLCDLKALLERNSSANLCRDKAILIEEEQAAH